MKKSQITNQMVLTYHRSHGFLFTDHRSNDFSTLIEGKTKTSKLYYEDRQDSDEPWWASCYGSWQHLLIVVGFSQDSNED